MLKIKALLEKVTPQSPPRNDVHITHFEDMAFYGGYEGSLRALKIAALLVNRPESLLLSAKYDGSPSIFFGPAPVSGEFFVATKGIFNKKPVIFKTEEEVRAKYDGDMAKKLIYALRYLPELNPNKILQADMLYTKGSVHEVELKGKEYLAFHPNTLYYAVRKDTPEAKRIMYSKIGIVLHTVWSGQSIEELRPRYEVNVTDYEESSNVYIVNPYRDVDVDISKLVKVEKAYKEANVLIGKMKPILDKVAASKNIARLFEQHHNTLIRQNRETIGAGDYTKSLKNFLIEKKVQIDLSDKDILALVIFHKMLIKVKEAMYNALDTNDEITAFVKKTNSVTFETDIEGYVIAINSNTKPLKLVDRAKFSAFNFDDDNIQKGWVKNRT